MVLREVPIADLVDAMSEPPRVILLGPVEHDALAIPFNPHVIEPAEKQVIMKGNQRPLLHLNVLPGP